MLNLVFVVIDGLDASGKSTQAFMLRDFLKMSGRRVFLRIHPAADNFYGTKARQCLYLRGKGAPFRCCIILYVGCYPFDSALFVAKIRLCNLEVFNGNRLLTITYSQNCLQIFRYLGAKIKLHVFLGCQSGRSL